MPAAVGVEYIPSAWDVVQPHLVDWDMLHFEQRKAVSKHPFVEHVEHEHEVGEVALFVEAPQACQWYVLSVRRGFEPPLLLEEREMRVEKFRFVVVLAAVAESWVVGEEKLKM